MSGVMEFYTKDEAASVQIGKDVYRRVSIPIDDFNAACDHYGFVMERTCKNVNEWRDENRVLHRDARIFKCSECGFKADDFYGDDEQSFPNYCPNCGAKVVEE